MHNSKGGKLTLINSSLTRLLTYKLFVLKAPVAVYKSIEKHWRNFLWKGNKEENSSHLISWSIVTAPKDKGALGITNLKDTNFALLCKMVMAFSCRTKLSLEENYLRKIQ